jgi:hypothetical protein
MQTTIDRENRREYREKILANLSAIVTEIDELDRAVAAARDHLHRQDRFFFQQAASIQEDASYGSAEDLTELYLDTCQILSRLARARTHISAAGSLVHFYDYSSNPVFDEYAAAEAKYL